MEGVVGTFEPVTTPEKGVVRIVATDIFENPGGHQYGCEFPGPVNASRAIHKTADVLGLRDVGALELRVGGAIIGNDSDLLEGAFELAYEDDRKVAVA